MDKTRKQRLQALISSRFDGNQQRFADYVAVSKGRVSQLLDEDEPFGDRAAKNLLLKLSAAGISLPDDYFNSVAPADEKTAPPYKVTPQEALAVLQAQIEQQASITSIHHLEHAWPFKGITREQWLRLTGEQQAIVESVVLGMLASHHASGGGGQHDKRAAA